VRRLGGQGKGGSRGLGICIESAVSDMLAQPGKLAEMGKNARSLSVDDSLDRIADALMKLVQK
jgi:UDP-N-acetylglucosamine:LPS N-acetylglucosamine transferase